MRSRVGSGGGRRGVLERVRQPVVGLGLGGDPMRVEPVALAFVTATLAERRLVRRDVADVEVALDEELGEVPAETAGSFDAPTVRSAQRAEPMQRRRRVRRGVREVGVVDLAAACVEHGRGEASGGAGRRR